MGASLGRPGRVPNSDPSQAAVKEKQSCFPGKTPKTPFISSEDLCWRFRAASFGRDEWQWQPLSRCAALREDAQGETSSAGCLEPQQHLPALQNRGFTALPSR